MKKIKNNIAVEKTEELYPKRPPFNPPQIYPELKKTFNGKITPDTTNTIYPSIRKLLHSLGLDKENFGKANWNPLGDIIKPGQTVVIKPNFVYHIHHKGLTIRSVLTDGSIIRAVLDYVYLALKGNGKIIVGDVPLQSAKWDQIVKKTGIGMIQKMYSDLLGFDFELHDFRKERTKADDQGLVLKRMQYNGDPKGYAAVNVGLKSELVPILKDYKKFAVTDYHYDTMVKHHNHKKNEYLIPKTVLSADVFINLPKMKTHRKGGITCCLKNLIGINGSKDWLPHHRLGSVDKGGDEYIKDTVKNRAFSSALYTFRVKLPWIYKILYEILYKPYTRIRSEKLWNYHKFNPEKTKEGSWYGNDTLWRTITDINKAVFYADKDGKMQNKPQRKYLAIIDAVLAGDCDGPMEPRPRKTKLIIGGYDPVRLDGFCANIMGFDVNKIPQIKNYPNVKHYKITDWDLTLKDIDIRSTNKDFEKDLKNNEINLNFKAAPGWIEHIER